MQTSRKNNTRITQVTTTAGTYRKTGKYLRPFLPENALVLSHGAGLDHTKPALIETLNLGCIVHDFEPNPEDRDTAPEFCDADRIPLNAYDAVVSHNVLNVLEPPERTAALATIFGAVKSKGHLVIGVRKWTGDVDTVKNFYLTDEPKSVWVQKAKGELSYQRGFDGDDLKNYVQEYADNHGHQIKIKKLSGIAATSIHVQVIQKGSEE